MNASPLSSSITELTDADLVSGFKDLVIDERGCLVRQLELIQELDRRQLFFEYPSLWSYLVQECGIEEWSAERKIRAARLMKRFPGIKEELESGKLNLTLLEIAQGVASREKLEEDELSEIMRAISGMSCRNARKELAALYPQSADISRDRIRPISSDLSEVRFVATDALLEKLEEIRGLLAHSHPRASLGELIDVLATEFRERHHPEVRAKRAEERRAKRGEKAREEVRSPVLPRAPSKPLIRELTRKTGYQCAYVSPSSGHRCPSKFGLEIDHVVAWAEGGETELGNLRYLCPSHHRRVSFLKFGDRAKFTIARRL